MSSSGFDPDLARRIGGNLAHVRARIAEAALRAGRPQGDITLVAVSKTHPIEAVRAAMAHGQKHFGENRVAEAAGKFEGLRGDMEPAILHLIGGLQTNKAAQAMGCVDIIESLDRPALLESLLRCRESSATRFLVQVNVGGEPQKSGVAKAEADAFIALCQDRLGAAVEGLMAIPPAGEDPRPHFTWLAERAGRHRLPVVSMGMSGDYEIAIACGATHVRVGSAIFGHRPHA